MTQLGHPCPLHCWGFGGAELGPHWLHLEDPSPEQVRVAVGALIISAARECWSRHSVPASGKPANYGVVRSKGDDDCSMGV